MIQVADFFNLDPTVIAALNAAVNVVFYAWELLLECPFAPEAREGLQEVMTNMKDAAGTVVVTSNDELGQVLVNLSQKVDEAMDRFTDDLAASPMGQMAAAPVRGAMYGLQMAINAVLSLIGGGGGGE